MSSLWPLSLASCGSLTPPIAAGFDAFLTADHVADASRRIIEETEASGRTDSFDTHPSLRDRLAAIGREPDAAGASAGSESAAVLIGDSDEQASALLEFALGRATFDTLKPIEWSAVGHSVFAERWRQIAASHAQWLSRLTVEAVPTGKHAFIGLGSDLVRPDEENVNSDERVARAAYVLGVGIGVLLLDQGWQPLTGPGTPVLLVRGSTTFDPLRAARALAEGITSSDAWKAECQALGIAGLPLGEYAAVAPTNQAGTEIRT
jgi:hypothetical protein